MRKLLIAIGPIAMSLGCADVAGSGHDYSSIVIRVVDGDSLYIEGVEPQIRLFGVDAPERGEPGYEASRDTLFDLTFGRQLDCKQVDTDRYSRIIARCYLNSGLEVNRAMINEPHTAEYCRYSKGLYGTC